MIRSTKIAFFIDQVLDSRVNGAGFAKLLNHRFRGRVRGDVEMQGFAPSMLDCDPREHELEAGRRYDNGIPRRDEVPVASKEDLPALPRAVTGFSLGNIETPLRG